MTLSEQWVFLRYLEKCTEHAANYWASLESAPKFGNLRTSWLNQRGSLVCASWLYNTGRHYNVRKLTFQHKALNAALNHVSKGAVYPLPLVSLSIELLQFLRTVTAKCFHAEQRAGACLAGRPLAAFKGWHKCWALDGSWSRYWFVWWNCKFSRGPLILPTKSELMDLLAVVGNVLITLSNRKEGPVLSDSAFLKKFEFSAVPVRLQSGSTTAKGEMWTLCLSVCSLHGTYLHSFRQKLGRGKVSKMARNELVGALWQDPSLCVREPQVEDNFQQSRWAATGATV